MPAPISVVIPTLNAGPALHHCLLALMEGLDEGLIAELIVSDGGSSDATLALAEEWGAQTLTGPASRGGQLRRGCAAARGTWLLVLHADTVLSEGWSTQVRVHMQQQTAGYGWLAFAGGGMPGRIVAGWANLRSRLGLPYGDQGLLMPMPLYQDCGGYPDQPLMEDVAIARALRGKLRPLGITATTSAEKYHQQGWLRRGAGNLWTLLRYGCGTPVDRLAKGYNIPELKR